MNVYGEVARAYARLKREQHREDLDAVLKQLPGAVRRMGLVRALESLAVGKHENLGRAVHASLAPFLLLDPDIGRAVAHLETCSRRELFRHHRRAIAAFDALATLHRIPEL